MANKTIGALTPTAAVVLTDKVPKEPTAGPPAEYFLISQLKTFLDTIYAPITGGAYVLKAGDTMTGLLQFSGTGHFGLRLNNLTTAQRDAIGVGSAGMAIWNTTTGRFDMNIGGSWKNFVRLDGDTMTGLLTIAQVATNASTLALTGYSLTGANTQSMFDMDGTWNTTGSPTALRFNITNTASGAASLLFDAMVNGASAFQIAKNGSFKLSGASTSFVIIDTLSDAGNQAFGFGRAGANQMGFYYGTAASPFNTNFYNLVVTTGMSVFPAGGITHASATLLTTSVALTNGAAAALGTLTNAPVAGNPTKWVPVVDNGVTRYSPLW